MSEETGSTAQTETANENEQFAVVLTTQEREVLLQLIDAAVRQLGLRGAEAAAVLAAKVSSAQPVK